MIINITVPRNYSYRKLIKKSNKFFDTSQKKSIFEQIDKKYYIFVRHCCIQINVIEYTDQVKKEIEKYLDYMFTNQYIGISAKRDVNLELNNIKIYEM